MLAPGTLIPTLFHWILYLLKAWKAPSPSSMGQANCVILGPAVLVTSNPAPAPAARDIQALLIRWTMDKSDCPTVGDLGEHHFPFARIILPAALLGPKLFSVVTETYFT